MFPFFHSVKWFDLSNFYLLLPIALFANIFHHSVPALSQPVPNKKSLSNIFLVTFLLCFVAYTLIGVSVATFFKNGTLSASNLNWTGYKGETGNDTPWWAHIIRFLD